MKYLKIIRISCIRKSARSSAITVHVLILKIKRDVRNIEITPRKLITGTISGDRPRPSSCFV